ncbi:hypothetical protein AC1031_013980 [Aphanomyces cochlioides]|nr:hypothetical protein AC1031_013980 [Aphanomyces cochlioides]
MASTLALETDDPQLPPRSHHPLFGSPFNPPSVKNKFKWAWLHLCSRLPHKRNNQTICHCRRRRVKVKVACISSTQFKFQWLGGIKCSAVCLSGHCVGQASDNRSIKVT